MCVTILMRTRIPEWPTGVIDKLDGKNWSTWKFQMKHLLLAKGLWGLVDGSETLAEDANAAAHADTR